MVYLGKFSALAPLLTVGLLVGVAVEWQAFHLPPENLEPYHEAVRETVLGTPYRIGDWVGRDNKVQKSAVELLNPNVILSREYQDMQTGRKVRVLLVHCKDARDVRGHYPPICYPVSGWTQVGQAEPRDWKVGDRTIGGMQYKFFRREIGSTYQITIYNFLIRPGGGIERDMPGLDLASQDRRLRPYGGAQFQMLFDDEYTSREERDRIFGELMVPFMEALDLIGGGARDEH